MSAQTLIARVVANRTVVARVTDSASVIDGRKTVVVVATGATGPSGTGTGGSGLPAQWTDEGNGAVVATVDDPSKTAITIEGMAAQSAALFPVVAQIPQRAALVTSIGSVFGQPLTFYATTYGAVGNGLSVELLDPGAPNASLTVTVVGTKLSFSLATDGAGAITSTLNDILFAWAGALPTTDAWSIPTPTDTSSIAVAIAETNLSGGADTTTVFVIGALGDVLLATGGSMAVAPPTAVNWPDHGAFEVRSPPDLYDEQGDNAPLFSSLDPFGNFTIQGTASGTLYLRSSPGRDGAQILVYGDPHAGGGFFGVSGARVSLIRESRAAAAYGVFGADSGDEIHYVGTDALRFWTGLARILTTGAVISNAHAEPADGDLNASDHVTWLDDTPGAVVLHAKAKDSAGALYTAAIPMTAV